MNVLLVIDMQVASFRDGSKHDLDGVVSRINTLAESVRGAGGKVIFILHDGTGAEGLVPETPGWQVLDSIDRHERDLAVRKSTNDAFYQSPLAETLTQLGADRLIITGWATDQCVDSTVRAAISRDYNVLVAGDCHTVSDRPELRAEQVIKHHNGIWAHLLTGDTKLSVSTAAKICRLIGT